MIINAATLDTLRQGLNTRFAAGLQAAPPMDETKIATVVPSNTAIENYPMLAFLDSMRKWIGPRQFGVLTAKNLSVTNDDYEATVGVPANAIEDDQVGIYGTIAEGKGRQCRALWPNLAIDALLGNGNWLDGNPFFGTTRKFGKNTISNYSTGALTATTFETAYQAMTSYLAHDGEPLMIVPDLLVVGPKLRTTAWNIVKNEWAATGTTNTTTAIKNPNFNATDVLVSPKLVGTYDDYWFLLCTTGIVKPVLVQKRKEGPLVALDKPTDANVFFGTVDGKTVVPGGVYVYGAHYRGASALTIPALAYGGFVA